MLQLRAADRSRAEGRERRGCRHIAEVLVLDNGSRDGTIDAAIAAASAVTAKRVIVARNRANYNLGGSHKAAYAYAGKHGFMPRCDPSWRRSGRRARPDAAAQVGEAPPQRRLHGRALHGRARRSRITLLIRVVGNHLFNAVFSLVARKRITDLGSGLNVLARSAFLNSAIKRLPDDLYFNPYLLLDLIGAGKSVTFFPISWREEDQVSNVKMVSQALRTLRAPLLYAFDQKKLSRDGLSGPKAPPVSLRRDRRVLARVSAT